MGKTKNWQPQEAMDVIWPAVKEFATVLWPLDGDGLIDYPSRSLKAGKDVDKLCAFIGFVKAMVSIDRRGGYFSQSIREAIVRKTMDAHPDIRHRFICAGISLSLIHI